MTLLIPDDVGVARALRSKRAQSDVLPGVELGLLLPCLRPNLRIALYGGRGTVALRAAEAISRAAPTSTIVFARDGYEHTPFEVARELVPLCPDLVYVCLGSPKQEEVALMLSRHLERSIIIGLGGSFDVWSGEKRRAPEKMRAMGLEWLWRMLSEPRRFWQLPALVSFKMHVFRDRVYAKFTKTGKESVKAKK